NKPCSLEIYEPKLDKHLECSALPLLNEQGETIGAVHILKDITERKKMEAEQQELRDRAEVSSRLAAIGEMAAGIAHEINNPLTGVIGFSELLSQEDLPPDLAQHVRYIIDGSNRVKDIVKRLLTFARQNKPFKTRTDIHELIDNTVAMRNYILETSNIEVVKEYELNLPWVTVDPGQIQQVFLNLIVNAEYAIKKAHDGGKLIIATRQEGSEITISFQDNGTGMDGETISSLFQPFFTTKEPGEGTGLGLALSHSIIQSHGGSIDVASKPGKGSTFTIRLPLIKSDPEPEVKAAAVEPSSSPISSGNILVVDDEASIRAFIKKVLHGQGYTVTVADTPYDALEKIKSNRYDAMLIDMRMPGMSGKELYEKMQSDIPSASSRMIFITGDTSDLTTREFLKKESLHCVSKPFTKKELLATLNEVLTAKQ
ncbi:MAG: response regulator, partial [Dehalococcoidales bacterium]|nr:response regulator [Dehalococcoidales bacterium]